MGAAEVRVESNAVTQTRLRVGEFDPCWLPEQVSPSCSSA